MQPAVNPLPPSAASGVRSAVALIESPGKIVRERSKCVDGRTVHASVDVNRLSSSRSGNLWLAVTETTTQRRRSDPPRYHFRLQNLLPHRETSFKISLAISSKNASRRRYVRGETASWLPPSVNTESRSPILDRTDDGCPQVGTLRDGASPRWSIRPHTVGVRAMPIADGSTWQRQGPS